jgi:hypothetical protein
MPLKCRKCGAYGFQLRRASGGAEAQCAKCGTITRNSELRQTDRLSPQLDDEIQVTAREMVRCYGKATAKLQAAKRASEMLREGNPEACQLWTAVVGAIYLL